MSKKLLALLLAVLMILSTAACGNTTVSKSAGTSQAAGTPANGNPAGVTVDDYVVRTVGTTVLGCFLVGTPVTNNEAACTAIYDSLWYIDPLTHEIKSNTLEDWYYEDDLTIVVKLKDNIYFSNGQKVTAEDAIFSITNYFDRKAPMSDLYGSLNPSKCYAEDELTAVFKFDQPWGVGIYTGITYLYCKSWAEEVGFESEEWYTNPVGSGPYKVAEFVKDDHFTLKLRDDYWNKDAGDFVVDEWVFEYYGDPATMAIEFEQGKLDIVSGLNNTDRDRYYNDPNCGVGVVDIPMNDMLAITFAYENNDKFRDLELRKAICHAVEWNELADMAFSTLATTATSSIPSTSPYYKEVGTYKYDPELSKQILADAGYTANDLTFHVVSFDKPLYKNIYEGFQYYLSQVGITLTLEFVDTATAMGFFMTPSNLDFCTCISPGGDTAGEPNRVWMNYMSTGAFIGCHILDDYFLENAEKGLVTISPDDRKPIYEDLQQYIHDNYLSMPVCEYSTSYGFNPNIYTAEDLQAAIPAGQQVYLWMLSTK